jgi:hypothetical protein
MGPNYPNTTIANITEKEHDDAQSAKRVVVVGGGLTVENATVNVGDVGLRNTSEVVINPATEEKQSQIVDAINNLGNIGATTIVKGGNVLDTYSKHDIDEIGSVTYIGYQDPNANWCIKKITDVSTTVTDFVYANESNNSGYTTYASAWIGRASLLYGDLSTLTFPAITEPFANKYIFSKSFTLPNTTTAYMMGVTDSLQSIFEDFLIKSNRSGITIEFYEAPTTSANGTLETTRNTDRTSSEIATMLVYSNPTVTNDGTLLDTNFIEGSLLAGGSIELQLDWKLKSGTKYIFKITNNSGLSANILGKFTWSEY